MAGRMSKCRFIRTYGEDIGIVHEHGRRHSAGHGGGWVHSDTKTDAWRRGHWLLAGSHVAGVHLQLRSIGVLQLLCAAIEKHRAATGEDICGGRRHRARACRHGHLAGLSVGMALEGERS